MNHPLENASPTKSRGRSDWAKGHKAIIGGSIAALDRSYVISLEAVNCQNVETLARQQAEAADKEHVLRAIAWAPPARAQS
jgi:hypothetical protein